MSHLAMFHENTKKKCKLVNAICPDQAVLYEKLQKKRDLAARFFVPNKYTRRYSVLIEYAHEFLEGHIQNVYLSAPPPPERIIRKIIVESYPAIMACIHARYFCEHGYEHNFAMMIVGPGGVGKTTYVTYLAAYLGGVLITSEDEILFGLMDMVRNRKWTPLLILDDINAIISKYWNLSKEERAWMDFFKMLDYAKDLSTILLTTARSEEGPPKKLRELTNYTGLVRILPVGTNLIYFVEWYPGTKTNTVPIAIDIWWPGLKLPQKLWQRIKEVRRLRSELLLIDNTLKLAQAGKIIISEQKKQELEQRMEEIRKQLIDLMENRWKGLDIVEELGGD